MIGRKEGKEEGGRKVKREGGRKGWYAGPRCGEQFDHHSKLPLTF